MNNLNINSILGRDQIYKKIKIILDGFQDNKSDITLKRGIYIYGNPGSGKTEFIVNLLREQNYDIINMMQETSAINPSSTPLLSTICRIKI